MNVRLLPSDEGTDLEKILTDTFPGIAHTELNLNRIVHHILGCRDLFERHMNATTLYAISERRREETMIHSLM